MLTKNNPVDIIESDGTTRTVQVVGLSDAYGSGIKVNGRYPGTLFGDDMRTTRRVPVFSASWSHGLPIFAADIDIIGNARWYIPPDANNPIYFDGISVFETGSTSTGKIYISSKLLNRYQPGQLSYFMYTAAFIGLDSTNGDYEMLIGAMTRGLASEGNFGKIKEGFVFGHVVELGVYKHVFRVYKNFEYTETVLDDVPDSLDKLNIYRLEVGYLGIHPVLFYKIDLGELRDELIHVVEFDSDLTNVSNPNLAIGAFIENKGNTTNIAIMNGSLQFGNYAERESPDPSARNLFDSYEVASILSGTDTVVAVYTLPEKLTMVKELNSGGSITGLFHNTIANKLNTLQAKGTANKFITVNVYLVPKTDVVATYTHLNPNVNALERAVGAAITSVSLTNATKIGALNDVNVGSSVDVSSLDILLTSDLVGVITVSCSQAITDFTYIISTSDLF